MELLHRWTELKEWDQEAKIRKKNERELERLNIEI